MRDEVRSILLFVRGVPISRWATKRETKETSFTEELSLGVYESTSRGLDALLGSGRIAIIPATSPSDEDTYLEVYSSLVFLYPELKTQDAILITTSIFQKADYFITGDRELARASRSLQKQYGLSVISPQRALRILTASESSSRGQA